MIIGFKKWFAGAMSISICGLLLLFAGDVFRYVAVENIKRQAVYLKGVPFKLSNDYQKGMIGNDAAGIRVLYRAGFFRTKIVEPSSVRQLKLTIPNIVKDLYFPDVWQLLWYLSFTGEDRALFAAIKGGLTTRIFSNSNGCLKFEECKVLDPSSTVNAASGDRLISLINREFVDISLNYYKHLALTEGRRKAIDALELLRFVDFDKNQSFTLYDHALVMSSFLTKPAVSNGRVSIAELDEISRVAKHYEPKGVKSMDADILTYLNGISFLRNGCFLRASQTFAARAAVVKHDPLGELFSFLAIRSVASPLIIKKTLKLDESDNLLVLDCKEDRPFSDFTNKIEELIKPARLPKITHIGLSTDVKYYRHLFSQDFGKLKEQVKEASGDTKNNEQR